MFPKPECLTWLTIYFTLSFATAAFNAITIVVFIKHRNLCNRGAYLIINLAVADMLVGGFSTFDLSYSYGQTCNIWKSNSGRISYLLKFAIIFLFLVCSLANVTAISLERVHATFWPFKHRVLKKRVYNVIIVVTWIIAGSMSLAYITLIEFNAPSAFFYLWNSFNAICLYLLRLNFCKSSLQFTGFTQQRFYKGKKTDCHIVYCNISISRFVASLCCERASPGSI